MSKAKHQHHLSAIQVLFRSNEVLSDEFKEELGDWLFHSVNEFFDENESPSDIEFAILINDKEFNIH